MKLKLLFAVATLAIAYQGYPHAIEMCEGFVPENDYWISTDSKFAGGITEQEFNEVIDKAEALYSDYFTSKGARLVVGRNWMDGTVNAYARRSGSDWIVEMFGGLARHPAITKDGFAVVICHEIGHHVGGAPKYKTWFGTDDWASNEGQADYYASLKCLRKYFADEDNEAALSGKDIDPLVVNRCTSEHADREMQAICMRISLGGQSVANLFQALRNESTAPRFDTPDPKQVAATSDSHPGTQCRMDTYFNGAVCGVGDDQEVSQSDYRVATCTAANATLGLRPRCWFKPN